MELIAEGAEARIYEDNSVIIKDRVEKTYRIKEIDDKLRKSRTNREAKVLKKLAENSINVPKLIRKDNFKLIIEKIKGEKVRDILEEDYKKICKEIGTQIREMHDLGIIHGDLTTSNMIWNKKLFFIDFGLSFFSQKIEDKAVDLHLLEEALYSKHHRIAEKCMNLILKYYDDEEIIKRLEKVKKRGRNKTKS